MEGKGSRMSTLRVGWSSPPSQCLAILYTKTTQERGWETCEHRRGVFHCPICCRTANLQWCSCTDIQLGIQECGYR